VVPLAEPEVCPRIESLLRKRSQTQTTGYRLNITGTPLYTTHLNYTVMMKLFIFCLITPLLTGCSSRWLHPTHESDRVIEDIEKCEREAYEKISKKDPFYRADTFKRHNPQRFFDDDKDFVEQREYVSECLEKLGYSRQLP
jgi:hypothetical protein